MQSFFKRTGAIFSVALIFICLLHVRTVIAGMQSALSICAFSIVPSLFLFMVLSDFAVTMILTGEKLPDVRIPVFFLGSLCGFPVGAILCERLYNAGILSRKDAERLVCVSNNVSPAFVLGAIGVSMLGDLRLGLLLYAAQLLSAAVLLLSVRIQPQKARFASIPTGIADALIGAVEKAVPNILRVCGWICVFGALLSVLKVYLGETLSFCLIGIFSELSNGISACIPLVKQHPETGILLCAFACGWSGLCVHMQIYSSAKSIKVKKKMLIFYKFLQGCGSVLFTWIGYKICFNT